MSGKSKLWWMPFGRVPEVEAAALAREIESPAPPQLLDVRTALEWRRSRIAGAAHTPITNFHQALEQLSLERDRAVVAVCLSAHRSIPAVRILRELGFENARQLAGGMKAWWRAGLPTIKGS